MGWNFQWLFLYSMRKFWYVNCVLHFRRCLVCYQIQSRSDQTSALLRQFCSIHEIVQFISILAWFWVNFLYFLTFFFQKMVKSKMAGEMTSFDVTWRYYQHKWYRPVEQAQGYPINVNLFRPALTERKPCKREGRGRGPSTSPPCTTVGVWVSLYDR